VQLTGDERLVVIINEPRIRFKHVLLL